ncbi:hypothetical protein [Alteromonas sp. 14N.309.X.WAT.G.H12]|uniref:hypothetical protein n=1 Tax=Alteromonas sp. 14N.309.X.WAT.G.H12 TaxID=3120824 RepID=UPI002FD26A9F
MITNPQNLPEPLQLLVGRSLNLCELLLPHCSALYPFAAIYEEGRIGCLFADDHSGEQNESYLIEQLQWRIIDTTTDTQSYSVLVYAATVTTDRHKQLNAIAINASDPKGEETMLLYPYFRVGKKIVVSPPIPG